MGWFCGQQDNSDVLNPIIIISTFSTLCMLGVLSKLSSPTFQLVSMPLLLCLYIHAKNAEVSK